MTTSEKKAEAFDRIAVLLGASDNWDGGADFLDDIADLVHRAVGPDLGHPGSSSSTEGYRALGRSLGLHAGNDWRQEQEDETEDVHVCAACRDAAISGEETPGRDPEEPEPFSALETGTWIVLEDGEPSFSADSCDACGTEKAGDRWPASLVRMLP